MYVYVQARHNELIVNRRNIQTRANDALLFITIRPNNKKHKWNIYYKGAQTWNGLSVKSRQIET